VQERERGREGHGGGWPHGAPILARSRHGGGGRTDKNPLTKTQLTRLNGGGGRGDHGEALGELGNAFLQRRVS